MKKMISILLLAVMLFALAGCDTYAVFNYYPEDRSTVWYCEEIDFEIKYVPNEYGNLVAQKSAITWDDVSYSVVGIFNFGYFEIILEKGETSITEADILLSGKWKYKGENVVIEITEDKVFDNTFEELVFKPEARNAE